MTGNAILQGVMAAGQVKPEAIGIEVLAPYRMLTRASS